jgi:hypothetical protein
MEARCGGGRREGGGEGKDKRKRREAEVEKRGGGGSECGGGGERRRWKWRRRRRWRWRQKGRWIRQGHKREDKLWFIMNEFVKSSKKVVSIKIKIRNIKIRVPNKQQVHDQKWDIRARTIVRGIGHHQIKNKKNCA